MGSKLEPVRLLAFAYLVELIRRVTGLLMNGGYGLLVRTLRQAENFSSLRIQPVTDIFDARTLLGLDVLRMRLSQLLRRNVHPLVDIHERWHQPTSCL